MKFRKRNNRRLIILAIAALIAVSRGTLTHMDFSEPMLPVSTTTATDVELHGPYDVARVVDGDTIMVTIDHENVKVRLIGMDTPESVHPDKKKNTEEGKQASAWVKDLLKGQQIYLEYDVGQTDRYGRTLAYVYLADQKTMVNRLLLEEGLAQTMTIQPNTKYANQFHTLQVKAREEKKGFWKTGFFHKK